MNMSIYIRTVIYDTASVYGPDTIYFTSQRRKMMLHIY